MAVKTITIDIEAYELLRRRKRAGQSFSQLIKEHFRGTATGRDLYNALHSVSLGDEALDAVDERIAARRKHRARAPRL